MWGNKLLVVKKGFNKYYYKYYSRPGGPGAESHKLPPWAPGVFPGGSPGGPGGRGAEWSTLVPRGAFGGGGWVVQPSPPSSPAPLPLPPPPLALSLSMFGQITLVPKQYRGRFEPIRGTFKSRQFQGWGGWGGQNSARYWTGTLTPSHRPQCVFDLNSRMAPETSGDHARVAVKQKAGRLSRWYRARAAQRRRRRPAEPP